MTTTRQRLVELSKECEAECKRTGFVGPEVGEPNFRLIYTSVKTYEQGNGFVIIGLNPGGSQADADTDDPDRPFREEGYSAYLDDDWQDSGVGRSEFQLAVQGIAMIMTGRPGRCQCDSSPPHSSSWTPRTSRRPPCAPQTA